MNVYLIKTPEYEVENFDEVCELLCSFEGPLKFKADHFKFNTAQFPFLENFWEEFRFPGFKSDVDKIKFDPNQGKPLSWRELFSICQFYRTTFSIPESDFIILLTKRKNALNFFSIFDEANHSFIQTSDWEYFTKAPQKFPIAYEVLANTLRSLMKLPLTIPNPWIHQTPMGCMNDFCENKSEVILKLRTGDICTECIEKMNIEEVDDELINHALGIFEEIRTQLLFKQGFKRNLSPKDIRIDPTGKIFIGGKQIELDYLSKTLFIFFLNHGEGVSLNDLQGHKEELLKIYTKLRPGAEESKINDLVKPYHLNGTFSKNKSSLNSKLKAQLGPFLANFYYLDGNRGEVFQIRIEPELVSVDIRY